MGRATATGWRQGLDANHYWATVWLSRRGDENCFEVQVNLKRDDRCMTCFGNQVGGPEGIWRILFSDLLIRIEKIPMETSTTDSYCLPKFHTSDVSLRPIRKATGSPFHHISRYLHKESFVSPEFWYCACRTHVISCKPWTSPPSPTRYHSPPLHGVTFHQYPDIYCAGDGPGTFECSRPLTWPLCPYRNQCRAQAETLS